MNNWTVELTQRAHIKKLITYLNAYNTAFAPYRDAKAAYETRRDKLQVRFAALAQNYRQTPLGLVKFSLKEPLVSAPRDVVLKLERLERLVKCEALHITALLNSYSLKFELFELSPAPKVLREFYQMVEKMKAAKDLLFTTGRILIPAEDAPWLTLSPDSFDATCSKYVIQLKEAIPILENFHAVIDQVELLGLPATR